MIISRQVATKADLVTIMGITIVTKVHTIISRLQVDLATIPTMVINRQVASKVDLATKGVLPITVKWEVNIRILFREGDTKE